MSRLLELIQHARSLGQPSGDFSPRRFSTPLQRCLDRGALGVLGAGVGTLVSTDPKGVVGALRRREHFLHKRERVIPVSPGRPLSIAFDDLAEK